MSESILSSRTSPAAFDAGQFRVPSVNTLSQVEIVTIGDELLLGFTVDTNAAFLSQQLSALGVSVSRRATCSDTPDDIIDTVRAALTRSRAVITTGGLGPTPDDLTVASVAQLFGRELYRDESVVQHLRDLWRTRGRKGELPESNYTQAMIPEGGRILRNSRGTAPGVWLEDAAGQWVVMLPGVPSEMRTIFREELVPMLGQWMDTHNATPTVVASRTVRTTGVPESSLAETLRTLGHGFDGMVLSYLPNVSGVDLRLTVRGLPADDAKRQLDTGAARLKALAGDAIYGEDEQTLAEVTLGACRARGLHVAVAESCTGGMLAEWITDIPGSSDIFLGGIVAYHNQVKEALLGVSPEALRVHGAVSEPVALQMAAGARSRLGAEVGIGITGIAGPDGGSDEKPVGTVWIAVELATPSGQVIQNVRRFQMIGDRDEVRRRSAQAALNMTRRAIATLT